MTRIHHDARLIEQMETLFLAGSLAGLSDGALLDRFETRAVGAEEAFAELVNRHGPMVLGVCRRVLVDPHLAEDAFQAVFLVLARRSGSVRNRDALGGWLHRVARRIAGRARKRADRRREKEAPMIEEVVARTGDQTAARELRTIIDQEIDRLRGVQRLPVVLCCLEGLSHEEASAKLQWPLGTVKSRLARGRAVLQGRLIRRGVAPASAALALDGSLRSAEASTVSAAVVRSTAALAWKARFAGAAASAAVAPLVRRELGSALAFKLKVGAALTACGLAVATVGYLAPALSNAGAGGDEIPKPAGIQEDPRPSPPPIAAGLSASGRVVDGQGKPIAGAKVFIREWSVRRVGEMAPSETRELVRGENLDDVLADRTTDAEGRFEFSEVPAPGFPRTPEAGKSFFPWDVVAMAPEHGLAWVQLTRQNQLTPISLTLGDEGIVRGKLVEPGGGPVAGAKVTVFGIDEPDLPSFNGLETENRLNLIWSGFLVVKTGADGRFTVRGLPLGKLAFLVVTELRHERVVAYAAAEAPGASASARAPDPVAGDPAAKIHHGDFTLTTRVADHVLRGRVVFEADGAPAPKATFIHRWEVEKLDAEGRFRLEGLVAGRTDLHAYDDASDAAPADVEVVIPETPRETEYTLVLPRGLVVQGRAIDGVTGKGVGEVEVRYAAAPAVESRFMLSTKTDGSGGYRIAVPPGPGRVEIVETPPAFERPQRSIGDGPDDRFTRPVDGKAGRTLRLIDFALRPADESAIRVVDQAGRPVFRAEVRLLDPDSRPGPAPGRTDADGRYRVAIRQASQAATLDVTSPDRREGGTVEIPGANSPGMKVETIEVRLRPAGSLSGRVLDENGKPLPGAVLILYRSVRYPDRAGMSFGKPVETDGAVAADGGFSYGGLIPDATYYVHVEVDGHAVATTRHVRIEPGGEARLDDVRLPASDQELTGVVVDPRGEPIAGASISYQQVDREQALYAPQGGVWFQDADASGRFHLRGLPRGAKRLMVYRREGADRGIRNLKYADVAADEKDVRIELPDADERLRGIE